LSVSTATKLDFELVDINDVDSFLESYAATAEPIAHLLAAHWLQSEVLNGGFHQFFSNPTGVLAPGAVAGLRAIGLDELAGMAAEAMTFFPSPFPRDQQARNARIEAYGEPYAEDVDREEWDPFYSLDNSFYAALGPGVSSNRFVVAADAYAERFKDADPVLSGYSDKI
jgi:hypothetical protein